MPILQLDVMLKSHSRRKLNQSQIIYPTEFGTEKGSKLVTVGTKTLCRLITNTMEWTIDPPGYMPSHRLILLSKSQYILCAQVQEIANFLYALSLINFVVSYLQMRLNPKQQEAVDIASTGHNLLISGAIGTGKTSTLQEIVREMQRQNKKTAVTAMTGLASQHIHGTCQYYMLTCVQYIITITFTRNVL